MFLSLVKPSAYSPSKSPPLLFVSIGNNELHVSNSKFLLLHEHLEYITEVGEVDVGVRSIVGIAKYLKRRLYEERYRAWSNGTGNAT